MIKRCVAILYIYIYYSISKIYLSIITVILQDTRTWFVWPTTGTVQNNNSPSKTSAELHREADGAFKAASREIWWWKFWVLSKKLGMLPIPIMVSTEGVHKMSNYYTTVGNSNNKITMNINKETCADFAGDQWSLHWARPADVAVPSLQPAVGLDLHSACSAAAAPGESWICWIFLDSSLGFRHIPNQGCFWTKHIIM